MRPTPAERQAQAGGHGAKSVASRERPPAAGQSPRPTEDRHRRLFDRQLTVADLVRVPEPELTGVVVAPAADLVELGHGAGVDREGLGLLGSRNRRRDVAPEREGVRRALGGPRVERAAERRGVDRVEREREPLRLAGVDLRLRKLQDLPMDDA